MHEGLIEQLQLICPRCRCPEVQSPLRLGQVLKRDGSFILEGFLVCPFQQCQRAYPILAGVPIVLKDIEGWWNSERPKLSSVLCDTLEMHEYFDALSRSEPTQHAERCLLSTYMVLHYGALDDVPPALSSFADPSVFLKTAIGMARPEAEAKYERSLDLGCSVGRYTFELACFSELAIGMDLNFNAVSSAARFHRAKKVCYERRKHGRCFEEVQTSYSPPQNVCSLWRMRLTLLSAQNLLTL